MLKKTLLTIASLLLTLVIGSRVSQAESSVQSEVELGFQQTHITGDEAKFQEYRDVANGIIIPHVGVESDTDSLGFTLDLVNLRQNDQSASFSLDSHRLNVKGSWDQTPHNYSFTSRTLYSDSGDGNITLPDSIQSALQTGGSAQFSTLYQGYLEGAHNADLQTRTDTGSLGLGFAVSEKIKVTLDLSEKMKKGYQTRGIAFGSPGGDSIEIAQPIDYKTYNSNIGLAYGEKSFNVGLNYNLSTFKNEYEKLTIDNPRRITDYSGGPTKAKVSAAPDNIEQNLSLTGGADLPLKSHFSALISMISATQNNDLLPYSNNSALLAGAYPGVNTVPEDRIDAKMLTWNQIFNLTGKPLKDLDWGLHFRSTQMRDKSGELELAGIAPYDITWSTGPFEREHFNTRKDSLSGEVGYQVLDPLQLTVGYGIDWNKREAREVHKTKEDSFNTSADYSPFMGLNARVKYLNARRRMKEFDMADYFVATSSSGELPGLRRYDISDRNRDQSSLIISASKGKFNVGVNASYTNDRYLDGEGDLAGGTSFSPLLYGLLKSNTLATGLDIDLLLSDIWSLNTYYQYDNVSSLQRSNQNSSAFVIPNPEDIWNIESRERFDTVGVGVTGAIMKVNVKTGYEFAGSRGSNVYTGNGSNLVTKVSLPGTKTSRQKIYVKGSVPINESLNVGLGYLFERYDVVDWATQTLPLFTGSTSSSGLWYGDAATKYRAHVVNANINYKF